MNTWSTITTAADVQQIIEASIQEPQIIFKDSTTCGISAHAKHRLEDGFAQIEGKAGFHYLDLLTYRSISNLIAQELGVIHQSPQIIVLKDRQVVYTSSHQAIDPAAIAKYL